MGQSLRPSLGSQALMLMLFQYLLCSLATSHTVSASTSDATSEDSSGGASPSNVRPTANAQLEIDSRVYPPCIYENHEQRSGVETNLKCSNNLPAS